MYSRRNERSFYESMYYGKNDQSNEQKNDTIISTALNPKKTLQNLYQKHRQKTGSLPVF